MKYTTDLENSLVTIHNHSFKEHIGYYLILLIPLEEVGGKV